MNAQPGVEIDHRNRNPSDNRRQNLRNATRAQNHANRRTKLKGYKGVRELTSGWSAQITVGGNTHSLGVFPTAEAAARAYDEKAKLFHADFAYLNFPEDK